MTLSTADVITPAKRPRMNGMAVPSGIRRRGRNDCSFKNHSSQAQSGALSGYRSHASARLHRVRPCLDLEDQIWKDDEQEHSEVEPGNSILLRPVIALVAPRDRLATDHMPLDRFRL